MSGGVQRLGTWFRREPWWRVEPAFRRAGPAGREVFSAVLELCVGHGYAINGERGFIPAAVPDPRELAAHLGEDETKPILERMRTGVEACVREGLLVRDAAAGGAWVERERWLRCLPDRTAREQRAKGATVPSASPTPAASSLGDGSRPKAPRSRGRVVAAAVGPLSASEAAEARVIADALAAGELRLESADQAKELERARSHATSGHVDDRARATAARDELVAAERTRRSDAAAVLRAGAPPARARELIAEFRGAEAVWKKARAVAKSATSAARSASRRPTDAPSTGPTVARSAKSVVRRSDAALDVDHAGDGLDEQPDGQGIDEPIGAAAGVAPKPNGRGTHA